MFAVYIPKLYICNLWLEPGGIISISNLFAFLIKEDFDR